MNTTLPTFTRHFYLFSELTGWGRNPRGEDLRGIPEFAEQLRRDGEIREDLHVFNLNGVLTVLAGHRRCAAGPLAGFDGAWCKLWDFTDEREAFKHLLTVQNGNDPFDAREMAKAAQSALEMGIPKEDLQGVMHRSEETVQLYLDLGALPGVVQDWVWAKKLSLGTVSLLRRLEPGDQQKAAKECVQGVLMDEPMSEAQAARHLQDKYLKPAEWRRQWQLLEPKLKRKLRVDAGHFYVPFEDRADYAVGNTGMPSDGYAHADEHVADAELVNPREPITWGTLARQLGVQVFVLAAPLHKDGYVCLVSLKMVRLSDELADSPTLKHKGKPQEPAKLDLDADDEGEDSDKPAPESWQSNESNLAEETEEEEEGEALPEVDVEEAFALLMGVHEKLSHRPDLALRDGCFSPLLARQFAMVEPVVPKALFQRLLRAFQDDARSSRKGLRWTLLLGLAAEICDGEDTEVVTRVMEALAEKKAAAVEG